MSNATIFVEGKEKINIVAKPGGKATKLDAYVAECLYMCIYSSQSVTDTWLIALTSYL